MSLCTSIIVLECPSTLSIRRLKRKGISVGEGDLNNMPEVFSRSCCEQMCLVVPFTEHKQIIFSKIPQGLGIF